MGDITVILQTYKRPYSLVKQIEAIKAQTIKPVKIMIWHNGNEEVKDISIPEHPDVTVVNSSENFLYHGRFAFALLAKTEYVAVFDDDTIPGSKWFENCLNSMKTHDGIMGTAGVYLIGDEYRTYRRVGWNAYGQGPHHRLNQKIQEVDLVGHGWFFRRKWLTYLWQDLPLAWDNGEDIQFCGLSYIHGGIKTYVPPHLENDKETWGSLPESGFELGNDAKGSWRKGQPYNHQRSDIIRALKGKGWQPCYTRGVSI